MFEFCSVKKYIVENLFGPLVCQLFYKRRTVWWRDGFLRIFTLAFLLFLAHAGISNPAGISFTFALHKITYQKTHHA